ASIKNTYSPRTSANPKFRAIETPSFCFDRYTILLSFEQKSSQIVADPSVLPSFTKISSISWILSSNTLSISSLTHIAALYTVTATHTRIFWLLTIHPQNYVKNIQQTQLNAQL